LAWLWKSPGFILVDVEAASTTFLFRFFWLEQTLDKKAFFSTENMFGY